MLSETGIVAQNARFLRLTLLLRILRSNWARYLFELGHHLGISGHEGHTQGNIFCIMYQGFIPDIEYQKKRSIYVNPHFCEAHIEILENNN